jgi:hypothetical protein
VLAGTNVHTCKQTEFRTLRASAFSTGLDPIRHFPIRRRVRWLTERSSRTQQGPATLRLASFAKSSESFEPSSTFRGCVFPRKSSEWAMTMTAYSRNVHLKPLRQGDLDGLCGVYAILNTIQWLLPKARDTDYLTKLFDRTIGTIYTIENIRDGGEEPELRKVFQFVKKQIAADFKVDIKLTVLADSTDNFKRPDHAMQSVFDKESGGAIIFGFEGFDSHWTVARGITTNEVILFDSWEYVTFDRRQFVWSKQVKDITKSNKIVISPTDLNWISIDPR